MTFLVTVTMTHGHDWANCTLQTLCPHQAEGTCVGRMWVKLDPSSSILQHFRTLLLVRAKGYSSWFCFELLLIAPCTQLQFTYCFFSILSLELDPSYTRKPTGDLRFLCVIENLIYLNCFTARILCLSQDLQLPRKTNSVMNNSQRFGKEKGKLYDEVYY